MLRKARNEYVMLQLRESEGDSKKFWRLIDNAFVGPMQKAHVEVQLKDPVTNTPIQTQDCSNYMNNFLVSAGPKLAGKIPDTPFQATFRKFVTRLKLDRISVEETLKIVQEISVHKSSAVGGLSSRLLKDAFLALPIHLCFIFNLSLDSGVFPRLWKKGNIILIPKEGKRSDPNNYRPVSLLPPPGKLLEKLVHSRLYRYMEVNHILTNKQGGFRPGHGTALTAGSFVTQLLEAGNAGNMTSAIFVDLRKAFDTIDHSILLKKTGVIWYKKRCTKLV